MLKSMLLSCLQAAVLSQLQNTQTNKHTQKLSWNYASGKINVKPQHAFLFYSQHSSVSPKDYLPSWWSPLGVVFVEKPKYGSSGQCCMGPLSVYWEFKGTVKYRAFFEQDTKYNPLLHPSCMSACEAHQSLIDSLQSLCCFRMKGYRRQNRSHLYHHACLPSSPSNLLLGG